MSNRPLNRVRVALVLLGALALFATSCGGGSTDTTVETSTAAESAPAASAAPTAPAEEPAQAESSLVATTVSGGQIDLGSLEGQDVVLWFWAPW